MNVKLFEGRALEEVAIVRQEAILGWPFPQPLRLFVAMFDGAIPEPNQIRRGCLGICVQEFISIMQMPEELRKIEDLPLGHIPIARDGCGNLVLLNLKDGKVRFWDHEVPDSKVLEWQDFNEFIESIEPLDKTEVKLKSGQVESAWIDPAFLKKLNEGRD